ncbi:lasso peptide biosynthesis B2 protein [Terriglobus albidus]|uniref:lasso peptide biosynthesis B2 protein n=1 Tax=Terriglobus albidus TaxID=1592106 RepID=UPI0021E0651C|nr:lasso peptide biosynthesis B2 protein [Terriglobus albidus]
MNAQSLQKRLRRVCLMGECALELLRARHMILHRPFDRTAATLQSPISEQCAPGRQPEIVRQVREAMGGILRRIPWRPTCLMRAIAAQRVLARRQVASCLTLAVLPTAGTTVNAHAWLEAAGIVVTGRSEMGRYAPIYHFRNDGGQDECSR